MRALGPVLVLLLASCAPFQDGAQRAINAVGADGDPATLVIHEGGVTFDPVVGVAENVSLYVGGQNLVESEVACRPLGNGVWCRLGDVSEATTVAVTGDNRSANVRLYRGEHFAFFYTRQ